ncbi:MAG: signal peptidase II [Pseudomonadota bacterium]
MRARLLGLAGAGFALLADQTTKHVVLANVDALWPPVPLIPGLNLVFVRNTGVSFGLLETLPWWTLAGLAGAIVCALFVWLWRGTSALSSVALGLMIGGASGNTLDRLRFEGVTDFIDVYAGPYHWPAFNIADVAVVSGAALMLLDSVIRPVLQAENPSTNS